MATKNIVPRANAEGEIGTTSKRWDKAWFTEANILGTTEQLRLSYDASNYATCTVGSTGTTSLLTAGSGTADSNFNITADGSLNLNASSALDAKGVVTLSGGGGVLVNHLNALGADATQGSAFKITNNEAGAVASLLIDHAGLTNNVVEIEAEAVTTGNVIQMDCNSLTTGSAIFCDVDDATTTNKTQSLWILDYDKSGITASGQANRITGLEVSMIDAAENVGSTTHTGTSIYLQAAATAGTINQTGIDITCTGGDPATSIGSLYTVTDGGFDIKGKSSASAADYYTLAVGAAGATTFTTVDNISTNAHFIVDADGDITLDADKGTIKFDDDGTTYGQVTSGGVTGINYRTIYVDAGSMVPQVTNGAAAGTSESADAYDIMNDYFAFDASTDEYVQFKLVMPEQWDGGTVKAKFYWKPSSSTTTSHDVVWSISGQSHADGGELGSWGTAADAPADNVVATNSPKKVHITAASGACTIAGGPVEGADELVYFRIMRDVSADDLNEDAHLLGVSIQYRETLTADTAW